MSWRYLGSAPLFGNGSGEKSYQTAVELVRRFTHKNRAPEIHRGAFEAIDRHKPKTNSATLALSGALAQEPLTIVALGPLTNIASLILNHPENLSNIKQVVAVAGQRSEYGLGFYPGRSQLFHLHDLNFKKDTTAFDIVLNSAVPVTLVPYEIASKITIGREDLTQLNASSVQAQWLAKVSKPWLEFWTNSLKSDGFFPFDSLAVGFLTMPSLYSCENIPVKIEHRRSLFVASRDLLLVSHDFVVGRNVDYCHNIELTFKYRLIESLK